MNEMKRGSSGATDLEQLDAWAAVAGTSRANALAMMSAVVAGIVGRNVFINGQAGWRGRPKCDTLVLSSSGRVPEWLDLVVDPVRKIDKRLVDRFRGFDRGMWEKTRLAFGSRRAVLSTEGLEKEQEDRHLSMIRPERHGAEDFLGRRTLAGDCPEPGDLDPGPEIYRFETAVRPGVLIESVDPASLEVSLANRHQARALLNGMTLDRIADLPGHAKCRFLDLLAGVSLPTPEILRGPVEDPTEHALLHAILRGKPGDLVRLIQSDPEFQDRFLILDGEAAPPAFDEVCVDLCGPMAHRWKRFVDEMLDYRRRGIPLGIAWLNEEEELKFLEREREFRVACRQRAPHGAALEDLPQNLFMLAFFMEMKELEKNGCERLFDIAHEVVEGHAAVFERIEEQRRMAQERELALILLRKIRDKQPVAFRDLVRSFDVQRSDHYRPTLTRLIEQGFVIEDSGRFLKVGPKPADALESEMFGTVARITR